MAASKGKKILEFEGLIAAPFTAYDKAGEINVTAIPKYSKYLKENNVNGAFVNGTTGESLSLSVEERKNIAKAWINSGKDNSQLVIIHISTNCITDTKELAQHAEANDADAIALLPPIYFRPTNNGELIRYISEISSSAPNTPLIYYHIPSMSGVNINLTKLVDEAKPIIPNFCGAKYTNSDLKDLAYCQAKHGHDFKLMLGCDELYLAALSLGVNTAVEITANIGALAKINNSIIDHFKSNQMKEALKSQVKLNDVLERMLKYGSLFPVLKSAFNSMTNIDVGETRVPVYPLNEKTHEDLMKEIKSLKSEGLC